MPLDPPSSAAATATADPSPPTTTTPSPSPNATRPPTSIPNSTTITTPIQPATAPPPQPPQPPQPPRPLPLPLLPTRPAQFVRPDSTRPNLGPIPVQHRPGYQDHPRLQQTGFPPPRSSLSSGLGFQIPPPPPPPPPPPHHHHHHHHHGVVTATMNIPLGVGHHPRGGVAAAGRGVGVGGGRSNGGAGRSAVFTIGHGPIKVSSSQGAGSDRNGHRDPNDRSRDDSFVTVRDRKVRFAEGTSMYALCRSWFRNGYYDGSRPKSTDIVRSLPKPLPLEVLETSSSKGPEADEEKESEDEKSVENLSAEDLLQKHVKRAKRVRARLSEKRLQRIARYKNRLALLLPPLAEQSRNDANGGT
ncbi:hypothetical protein Droror1_Dr00024408 [Drosera rotundifolia]